MEAALAFLAKHWKEVALVVLLSTISVFWWQDHGSLVKAYDASVKSYEDRIRSLNESHARETQRKNLALQEYQEKLKILEEEYEEYKQNVKVLKEQRIEELVILRTENPKKLIGRIEEEFGFQHVK
jgi:hypothetical protein